MDEDGKARFVTRVKALESFEHRGSATDNEASAAEYLAGELRRIGIEPVLEPFDGLTSCGAVIVLHVAVSLVAAVLVWVSPWTAVVVGMFALASMLLEQVGRVAVLSRILRRHPSRNVVARVPAEGAPSKRIVVLGHYDTQRTGMIWNEGILSRIAPLLSKSPGPLQSPLFLPMFAMVLVPLAAVIATISPDSSAVSVIAGTAVAILSIAFLLLAQWAMGPFVPGASYNATGSAAVLAIAESWLAEPTPGVELVALLTGCEESGLYGADAFVRAHEYEAHRVRTLFVNLDSFGYGRPRYIGREHSLAGTPAKYPPHMLEVCESVASELGLQGAGPRSLPVQSDAYPFLLAGMEGVSIMSFEDDGHMPNYHQLTDTSDRLSFSIAWQAVCFGEEVVRRIASR